MPSAASAPVKTREDADDARALRLLTTEGPGSPRPATTKTYRRFKVWPRAVEDALYAHPAVHEVAVVGQPDDYRGETVVGYVSFKAGESASEAALIDFTRERLAAYKCPRSIHALADLPKTQTGKIRRNALRDSRG